MNFPLEGPRFLGALRWWSWKRLEREHLEKSSNSYRWFPRFHVYTFARASAPRAGDEEEMAINLVANELLPPYVFSSSSDSERGTALAGNDGSNDNDNHNDHKPGDAGTDHDTDTSTAGGGGGAATTTTGSSTIYRRTELNDEFGTDISTRMVRDVAPGKVVVCVGFSVTPKLIRYMQGDYS